MVTTSISYKICRKCKNDLPHTEDYFYNRKSTINGLMSVLCKKCIDKRNHRKIKIENDIKLGCCNKCLKYKELNNSNFKERKESPLGFRLVCSDCRAKPEQILSSIYKSAKCRCKGLEREFDISTKDLTDLYKKQNGCCALTNIPFDSEIENGKKLYGVSIDRIDSTKGYIKDNIQLVCNIINTMKHTLTIEELKLLCTKIIENGKNQNN